MPGKVRELSWSLSRARMFEECPRRFYYQYYFAQTGYAPDAPEEAGLALEMKCIKSLDMWIGEIVHQAIQWVLEEARSASIPTEEAARAETRRRLSEGWKNSLKQLWRAKPDDACPNLFEHYYGIEVGSAVTNRLKDKAFLSVQNFMNSDILRQITSAPGDRWLPIEKYASFRLDGLLMYVKFDFALRNGGYLTVYDWKTGKPTQDEARQLACYALYASGKWEIPIESTKVCAVHLQPELDAEEQLVDEAVIEDMRIHVKQSFNSMVKSLRNPARNLAAMEDFPMTGNLLRCVRCSYKGICEQGKIASGDVDDLPIVEDWEA